MGNYFNAIKKSEREFRESSFWKKKKKKKSIVFFMNIYLNTSQTCQRPIKRLAYKYALSKKKKVTLANLVSHKQ